MRTYIGLIYHHLCTPVQDWPKLKKKPPTYVYSNAQEKGMVTSQADQSSIRPNERPPHEFGSYSSPSNTIIRYLIYFYNYVNNSEQKNMVQPAPPGPQTVRQEKLFYQGKCVRDFSSRIAQKKPMVSMTSCSGSPSSG